MTPARLVALPLAIAGLAACSRPGQENTQPAAVERAATSYFKVDPATAGTLTGRIRFVGRRPVRKAIDMDQDPECARLHKNAKAFDESLVANPNGALANVFVYVKSGLEDKKFEVPPVPATIDQKGCWFQPHVLGVQTGQTLQVTNSDPLTHNIHPLAQINREWNQSQAGGDAPLSRKFSRPEIMVPVKCNLHRWMRAYIGVVDHPYFAVSRADGAFKISNLPPGAYTLAAWHETLGTQEQQFQVAPSAAVTADFNFKDK